MGVFIEWPLKGRITNKFVSVNSRSERLLFLFPPTSPTVLVELPFPLSCSSSRYDQSVNVLIHLNHSRSDRKPLLQVQKGAKRSQLNQRIPNPFPSFGLITVFETILTGRHNGQKLQCLYGNSMAKNVFQKLNFAQFLTSSVKTLGRRLYSLSLMAVTWLEDTHLSFLIFHTAV